MRQTLLVIISMVALLSCDSPSAEQPNIESYLQAKRLFWGQLYKKGGETLYCGQSFGPSKSKRINVEHVLPMSWVMKKLNCRDRDSCRRNSSRFGYIEADMHNLYPALRDINQSRGSMPFAIIKGEQRQFGSCDFELNTRKRVVEPRSEVRGDIARAMMYMHDRYAIRIHARQGKLLKQWNRQDPPDAFERRRNDVIESLQGNRNRFIDKPAEIDRLRF